jgi:transposase
MEARILRPFTNGRHFAASLGLTPRLEGTGGKVHLGALNKRGNGYLRRLLVNGATWVRNSKRAKQDPWIARSPASKPRCRGLGHKMARIGWALMMREEDYRAKPEAASLRDGPRPSSTASVRGASR